MLGLITNEKCFTVKMAKFSQIKVFTFSSPFSIRYLSFRGPAKGNKRRFMPRDFNYRSSALKANIDMVLVLSRRHYKAT